MTVGVGIIGCGFIGRFHIESIRTLIGDELVDAEITAVCDTEPIRAANFAEPGDVSFVAESAAEVLNSRYVDAVYVCTPTVSHADLVEAAAAAGKAVFCEKPLAFNGAAAGRMVEAVAAAGVVNQAGLVLRYSPTYAYMRERMRSGNAGAPMTAVFRDDQFFPVTGHYASTWRADRTQAGAGALTEHSIHDVDVLGWLLGPLAGVSAQTRNFAGHPGIEDLGVVTFEFTSGAVASLVSVWHDVLSRPSLRRLEVFCRDLMLWTDHDFMGPVHVVDSGGDTEVAEADVLAAATAALGLPPSLADVRWAYTFEDWVFLEACAGRRPAGPGLADAAAAHRVLDLVYASAAAGGERLALT